jgi:hypothetical protein
MFWDRALCKSFGREAVTIMQTYRSRSITTKVTAEEYELLKGRAAPHTVSEWLHHVLLRSLSGEPAHQVLLAEVLALRVILLNVQFGMASGAALSADAMRDLIDRADREKVTRAHALLADTFRRAK